MSDAGESRDKEIWNRLGVLVRDARKALGYRNLEAFGAACDLAKRTVSAIESGERTNYSAQTLERLEAGLNWPRGTIERVLADPDFDPAKSIEQSGVGLLFRRPEFDPSPVQVGVDAVIKVCDVLDQAAASVRSVKSSRTRADDGELPQLAAAVIPVCWIYILRMVETNCYPGEDLHPAVRPSYDAFFKIQKIFSAPSDLSSYAQWLVGDRPNTTKADRDRYHRRWEDSVHPLSEDGVPASISGGLFRPPTLDDSPVMVDVDLIVHVIEVLTAIAEAHGSGKSKAKAKAAQQDNPALWSLAVASLQLCWPYVTRLVEDNVKPGVEVNPAVRQQYNAFRDVQAIFAPDDSTALYVQWLTGDVDGIGDQIRQRYLQRWNASKHQRKITKRAE